MKLIKMVEILACILWLYCFFVGMAYTVTWDFNTNWFNMGSWYELPRMLIFTCLYLSPLLAYIDE